MGILRVGVLACLKQASGQMIPYLNVNKTFGLVCNSKLCMVFFLHEEKAKCPWRDQRQWERSPNQKSSQISAAL